MSPVCEYWLGIMYLNRVLVGHVCGGEGWVRVSVCVVWDGTAGGGRCGSSKVSFGRSVSLMRRRSCSVFEGS